MGTRWVETMVAVTAAGRDSPWVDYLVGNLVAQWDMTMADLTELQRVVMKDI